MPGKRKRKSAVARPQQPSSSVSKKSSQVRKDVADPGEESEGSSVVVVGEVHEAASREHKAKKKKTHGTESCELSAGPQITRVDRNTNGRDTTRRGGSTRGLPEQDRQRSQIEQPIASTSSHEDEQTMSGVSDNPAPGRAHRTQMDASHTRVPFQESSSHKSDQLQSAHAIQRLEAENKELRELVETRRVELQTAQAFSQHTDQFSTAELRQMAAIVNVDIFQTASFLVDRLLSNIDLVASRSKCSKKCKHVGCLPPKMAHSGCKDLTIKIRRRRSHGPDLGQQFILQQMLVSAAACQLEIWSGNPEVNDYLSELLELVTKNEPAAVHGKWRSLAHKYSPERTDEARVLKEVYDVLLESINNALQDIGYSKRVADLFKHIDATDLYEAFKDKLKGLAHHLIKLRNALQHSVTSHRIRSICWPPGSSYCSKLMDNTYEEDEPAGATDKTLATVSLGLRIELPDGYDDDEEGYILKPGVVLYSLLSQLDRNDD